MLLTSSDGAWHVSVSWDKWCETVGVEHQVEGDRSRYSAINMKLFKLFGSKIWTNKIFGVRLAERFRFTLEGVQWKNPCILKFGTGPFFFIIGLINEVLLMSFFFKKKRILFYSTGTEVISIMVNMLEFVKGQEFIVSSLARCLNRLPQNNRFGLINNLRCGSEYYNTSQYIQQVKC